VPNPPTQLDIARALGISKMAVSLALRNSRQVSAALRQQVAEAAERLGYQINAHARGLAVRRHSNPGGLPLALLNFWNPPSLWKNNFAFRHIQEGCRERAEELGYHLDEIELKGPGMTAKRANQILKSRGIRGVLIPPTPYSHSHLRLEWGHFAAAAIGLTFRRPNLHRTAMNMALSIQLTLHHLKHARYRRIGLLLDKAFIRRMDGIPEALFLYHQKDWPAKDRVPIHWCSWDRYAAGLSDWLKRHRPDVVLTYWPSVFKWLQQAGYSIPGDIGFVSLGWHGVIWEEFGVEATGISMENEEMGARAVDLVVGQLERHEYGVPAFPTITLVTPRWIPGETIRTRAPKAAPEPVQPPFISSKVPQSRS
jgi:DNA-binding LacI/PurR family transcriptional regulator